MLNMSEQAVHDGSDVVCLGEVLPEFQKVLAPEALQFVARLHLEFNSRRLELISAREVRQGKIDAGQLPVFLPDTQHIRAGTWRVAPVPDDLQKRWVEITGPAERKMMINALNSGADVFMADFEDSLSPTWENVVRGQINLIDAVRREITFTNPAGKEYRLNEETATLLVRPRGWHLVEKHVLVGGEPISASIFDFGLALFHNAQELLRRGSGPYFYLAKLESHQEARLWNDIFIRAQALLGIPLGSIRATVLIENVLAAFEMDEILFELREHAAGLNAGRWDYIFSVIKKFRHQADFVLPDRAQITMTVPFMRAYTELMVKVCHKRGAHAIGGMAAFIPSRKDPEINEMAFEKVREDKMRESADGFDGTWVAHPDLVPVARQVFREVMGDRPHQKHITRDEVQISASDLVEWRVEGGEITEEGLRLNINVGLLYLESWLRGAGAAAIYNLMEDTATAEISRAQLWQWINHPSAALADGRKIDLAFVLGLIPQELSKIQNLVGGSRFRNGAFEQAENLFRQLISAKKFTGFLTQLAYEHL